MSLIGELGLIIVKYVVRVGLGLGVCMWKNEDGWKEMKEWNICLDIE